MLPALIIATLFYIGVWSKQSKYVYRLSFVLLYLFVVFRSTNISGYDSVSYMRFFDEIPTLNFFSWRFWETSFLFDYGWGYALINSIAKTIHDSYFFYQLFDTSLVFLLLFLVIRKLKLTYSEKCLFMFIFFCSKFLWYFFILLRQNIANLIVWYVFIDWEPNRNCKGLMYARDILLLLIATSIHSTAAFMLFAYPFFIIIQSVKDKIILRCTIICAVVFTIVSTYMMPLIWRVVIKVAGERYHTYDEWGVGGINPINYILRIAYVLLIYWYGKKYYKYKNSYETSAMAVVAGSLNVSFNVRFVEFFAIGYYSGMSHIKGFLQKQDRTWIMVGIYILYVTMLIQYILVNNPKMIDYQIFSF